MEHAFLKGGLAGRSCVLRAICEVAEAPFAEGMLGEMVNSIFTASLAGKPTQQEVEDDLEVEGGSYLDYLEAEVEGQVRGRCGERYPKCVTSPFDILPQHMKSRPL
ncbi:uncharacterized protein LOC126988565 isoform X2 [Eriocheir sinensis]|nr:uncharacterized protein LOC126988565 isoform X2 [Eriocheir sinensis]